MFVLSRKCWYKYLISYKLISIVFEQFDNYRVKTASETASAYRFVPERCAGNGKFITETVLLLANGLVLRSRLFPASSRLNLQVYLVFPFLFHWQPLPFRLQQLRLVSRRVQFCCETISLLKFFVEIYLPANHG